MVRKMKKDPDYVVKVEKAISEKYGEKAIENPRKYWNKEKEQEYLNQMKEFYKKLDKAKEKDSREEVEGVLISKKFDSVESTRTCPVCDTYSFDLKDDLYMTKFQCCFTCYVEYIEDREDRWKQGWRPNNTVILTKQTTN